MAKEYCGDCMQPMRGGKCENTGCKSYVSPPRTHSTRVGNNSGRFDSDGPLGHPNTGLVADRGPAKDRPDNRDRPDYQAKIARDRAAYDKVAGSKGDIKGSVLREKARKEANKAIGKTIKNFDRDGAADCPPGTKAEQRSGLTGKRWVIVKDPKHEIWKK